MVVRFCHVYEHGLPYFLNDVIVRSNYAEKWIRKLIQTLFQCGKFQNM